MFKSLLKLLGFSTKGKANQEINVQITQAAVDFMNRPVYKKLTIEIIDSTPDDLLVQTVFDSLSNTPSAGKTEYEMVINFNKFQQAVYTIWILESEVNNGGFNQYYANTGNQFSKLTPNALRLVGANKFADLVTKANKIYEDEEGYITQHQDGTLEGFSKSYADNPLNKLDNDFFECYSEDDLMKLQIDFIRGNKTEFID